MADRPAPSVRLYQNPWSETVGKGLLLAYLTSAATYAEERLVDLVYEEAKKGEVEKPHDSFACVILDPTRPRWQRTAVDRVMAAVLLGPDAERLLPNGLAKADANDRHCVSNGFLVNSASVCLGNGEFAWGNSAEYVIDTPIGDFVITVAGGSGLTEDQDLEFAYEITKYVMDRVMRERDRWLKTQRKRPEGQRWYSADDTPAPEYAAILKRDDFITTDF